MKTRILEREYGDGRITFLTQHWCNPISGWQDIKEVDSILQARQDIATWRKINNIPVRETVVE